MEQIRKCGNCKFRYFNSWDGMEACLDYEITCSEEEQIKAAADCPKYVYGTPDCLKDDEYTPCSSNRDYGPSNPWDAPGMSIRDFI